MQRNQKCLGVVTASVPSNQESRYVGTPEREGWSRKGNGRLLVVVHVRVYVTETSRHLARGPECVGYEQTHTHRDNQ